MLASQYMVGSVFRQVTTSQYADEWLLVSTKVSVYQSVSEWLLTSQHMDKCLLVSVWMSTTSKCMVECLLVSV